MRELGLQFHIAFEKTRFGKKFASLELLKGNPFPLRWARIVAFGAFLSKTLKEFL